MEGFEFECSSLDYGTIENKLCNYYDLGFPNSSNFIEVKSDEWNSITVFATNGSVSCCVRAYQRKDSKLYLVSVSSVSVKRSKH